MSRRKISLKRLASLYQGKRIIYTKAGQKGGWTGVIQSVFSKSGVRFNVLYDNGVEQSYRMDAIHHQRKSWGAHETYIELISDDDKRAVEEAMKSITGK
jgi:hypothetical protein